MQKGTFISGDCSGSYMPKNLNSGLNDEDFNVDIRSIVVLNPVTIDYYNKVELENEFPQNINPPFIHKVYLVQEGQLFTADFTNTIISPSYLSVRNILEKGGSEGTFTGTFYGTLLTNIKEASGSDITSDAKRFISPAILEQLKSAPQVNTSKDLPLSQSGKCENCGKSQSGFLSGCSSLFWQLLMFCLFLLFLMWLFDRGCSSNNNSIVPIPCDTVFIHDTIFVPQEVPPKDTVRDELIVQDSIIELYLFDCKDNDGDRIDLYFNKKLIDKNVLLSNFDYKIYKVEAKKGQNEIIVKVRDFGQNACTVGVYIKDPEGNIIFERCKWITNTEPYKFDIIY